MGWSEPPKGSVGGARLPLLLLRCLNLNLPLPRSFSASANSPSLLTTRVALDLFSDIGIPPTNGRSLTRRAANRLMSHVRNQDQGSENNRDVGESNPRFIWLTVLPFVRLFFPLYPRNTFTNRYRPPGVGIPTNAGSPRSPCIEEKVYRRESWAVSSLQNSLSDLASTNTHSLPQVKITGIAFMLQDRINAIG